MKRAINTERQIVWLKRMTLVGVSLSLIFLSFNANAFYYNLAAFWKAAKVAVKAWSWVGGNYSDVPHGFYGALGVAHDLYIPGGRDASFLPGSSKSGSVWVDPDTGDAYFFGGQLGVRGNSSGEDNCNMLWKFTDLP